MSSSTYVSTESTTTTDTTDEYLKEFKENRSVEMSLEIIEDWRKIQDELRTQIIPIDTEEWQRDFSKLKYIAGLDISCPKEAHSLSHCEAFTAIVIISYPSLEIVHQEVQQVELTNPYVPSFLAFREYPAVCQLVEKVLQEKPDLTPDVLLIDGNGILHPQRCGLACHIGHKLNIPTIGVAKNLFHIDGIEIEKTKLQGLSKTGEFIPLITNNTKEVLGMALKTSEDTKNPVYVSIGHKISLESARKVVLAVSKYRVPEPIRTADHISREYIRMRS